MSDPERLLDHATGEEARLLSAGMDEPLPEGLAKRTLAAVAAASAVSAAAGSASAASAKTGAAKTGAAITVKAITAKTAGGGLLGAIGAGALAGVITVGAYQIASVDREPPRAARTAPITTAAPTAAPIKEPPAPIKEIPAPRETASPAPPASADRAPSARAVERSDLALELTLLDEARSALRAGDAARARRALDRYAREAPNGQMKREAAVLGAEVDAALSGAIDSGASIP